MKELDKQKPEHTTPQGKTPEQHPQGPTVLNANSLDHATKRIWGNLRNKLWGIVSTFLIIVGLLNIIGVKFWVEKKAEEQIVKKLESLDIEGKVKTAIDEKVGEPDFIQSLVASVEVARKQNEALREDVLTFKSEMKAAISKPKKLIMAWQNKALRGVNETLNFFERAGFNKFKIEDIDVKLENEISTNQNAQARISLPPARQVVFRTDVIDEKPIIQHSTSQFILFWSTQDLPEVLKRYSTLQNMLHGGYLAYFLASMNDSPVFKVGEQVEFDLGKRFEEQHEILSFKYFRENIANFRMSSNAWRFRSLIGQEVTDKLMFKSFTMLRGHVGYDDCVQALKEADKELFQGKHLNNIRKVFAVTS